MTPQDKQDLRALRDDTIDEEDKKLLRKTINYIQALEGRLQSINVFARSILNEVKGKGDEQ